LDEASVVLSSIPHHLLEIRETVFERVLQVLLEGMDAKLHLKIVAVQKVASKSDGVDGRVNSLQKHQ